MKEKTNVQINFTLNHNKTKKNSPSTFMLAIKIIMIYDTYHNIGNTTNKVKYHIKINILHPNLNIN
jgi:hypothetical protein